MTKTTESRWRSLIAVQERSGQSAREFAAARGISPATLYWWRSRLRRERGKLVPVAIVEEAPQAKLEPSPHFEVLIDDSVTVRVPLDFDEGALRRLLRALRC